MKKIVFIFFGNYIYDARIINMSHSLIKHKYSVSIIGLITGKERIKNIPGVSTLPIQLKCTGKLKYLEFYYKSTKLLNTKKYDVIIAGDIYSLASASQNKFNSKIVYDCREIYSALAAHINRPLYSWLLTKYEGFFMKYVHHIIVTAKTDYEFLYEKYSCLKSLKWDVLYNFPMNYSYTKTINLKKYFNIPDSHTLICYQGVIQKGRGIAQLFSVIQQANNLAACIIGDGEAKQYFTLLAKKLNIFNRVFFINKTPYLELFKYTAACDIGWAVIQQRGLSNQFALPNKFFEYGLMNLPVIASRLPNMVAIFKQYNLGVLVDPLDTAAQLKAVGYLKKKKNNYQKIIQNNFIWDKQENQFIQLINE